MLFGYAGVGMTAILTMPGVASAFESLHKEVLKRRGYLSSSIEERMASLQALFEKINGDKLREVIDKVNTIRLGRLNLI